MVCFPSAFTSELCTTYRVEGKFRLMFAPILASKSKIKNEFTSARILAHRKECVVYLQISLKLTLICCFSGAVYHPRDGSIAKMLEEVINKSTCQRNFDSKSNDVCIDVILIEINSAKDLLIYGMMN